MDWLGCKGWSKTEGKDMFLHVVVFYILACEKLLFVLKLCGVNEMFKID